MAKTKNSGKIRVLVVEDSATARQILVQALEADGDIRVVGQAGNGLEGVALAEELNPDLITMDILMPGLDGLEATRRIMARRKTPILMVTAISQSSEHNIAFEALAAGALDVISKETKTDRNWPEEFVDKVKDLARLAQNSSPQED